MNTNIDRKQYFEHEDQDTNLLTWAKNILEQIKKANPYRALWELSQNARDTARNSKVNITITLTDKDLSFSHDGATFRPNSLKSLIRQQSSKNNQENSDQIGQYGTGFATTHTHFQVTSSLYQHQSIYAHKTNKIRLIARCGTL